jgi:hypothetical protein
MGDFEASDWVSALAIAAIAELGFLAMMYPPDRPMHVAEIDDSNSRPIAVAITPVPLLKQGGPATLPASWQRKAPPPPEPQKKEEKKPDAPLPSPQASQTPDAIPKDPVPDAAVAQNVPEASTPSPVDPTAPSASTAPPGPVDPTAPSASTAPAASGPGDPNGSPNGTETDPLKARALDRYKAALAAWLRSAFNIRGKVPFDKLKTLRASAVVTASGDRTVTSFSVVAPSGDATFDGEMRSALQSKVGATLPAPPPNYPEFAQTTISVSFSCTIQSQCE